MMFFSIPGITRSKDTPPSGGVTLQGLYHMNKKKAPNGAAECSTQSLRTKLKSWERRGTWWPSNPLRAQSRPRAKERSGTMP